MRSRIRTHIPWWTLRPLYLRRRTRNCFRWEMPEVVSGRSPGRMALYFDSKLAAELTRMTGIMRLSWQLPFLPLFIKQTVHSKSGKSLKSSSSLFGSSSLISSTTGPSVLIGSASSAMRCVTTSPITSTVSCGKIFSISIRYPFHQWKPICISRTTQYTFILRRIIRPV